MLSEIPSHPERAILALEIKLALAKGEKPAIADYKQLVEWYDHQLAIGIMSRMPRKLYQKLSARQNAVITNQSDTFGIPISTGTTVDLFRVVQWFHNFVSEWGPKIRSGKIERDRLSELAEKKIEAEIEVINNKLTALQLDNEKKRGAAVPVGEVRSAFTWLSVEWRKFGERLGKKFGPDSQRFLNEFLERLEADAKNHMPNGQAPAAQANINQGEVAE